MFCNKGLWSQNAVIIALLGMVLAITGAFNSHISRIAEVIDTHPSTSTSFHYKPSNNFRRKNVILNGWLGDAFKSLGLDLSLEKLKYNPQLSDDDEGKSKAKFGTVVRTAVKGYDKSSSEPTSRLYTTKKEGRIQIDLAPEGVQGDYNHYRTTALSSTPDRAVSILTTDILKMLHDAGWKAVADGDLGENIYVDGIDYTFFELGKRYIFKPKGSKEKEEGVTVEITERIEPCGNLCRLPYINDEKVPPKDRLENCKKFLLWLDAKEGLRGWYGKIIGNGGSVKIGDEISALVAV